MNKNLLQLGQQLAGIWKQLGLNQRITIVAATLAVALGLGGLAFWSSRADYSLLYGKLDEAEAAKVIAALDEAKVPYKVGGGGGSIMVPGDKVYQVRMQLAGKGIPRGEGVGFEIFDKANFGISDFVQRANYTRAVQGELARTISQLDQIESARVMIVMPENRLLTDSQRKPTASVLVRVKGSGTLPASSVNSIRLLVANSVEGLQPNNVSISDNQGNVLSENDDDDSIAGLSNGQLAARRNLEQYLTKKAEGMLEKVVGPGQAVVRISAEINQDTTKKSEEKFDPDGQVIRSSTINDETTDSETAAATGGTPGTAANSASGIQPDGTTNVTVAATPPVNRNNVTKKVTTTSYEIGKSTTSTILPGGGIKRLSAAVFIAQQFEGTGTDRKAKPRSKEELDTLRRVVQSAIGIQEKGADPNRVDEIELAEIPFNDQPAAELVQQIEKQDKRQFWTDLALKLIYPVLAVGVLFMFWRAFKAVKTEEIPIGVPIGNGNGHARMNGNGNGHGRVGKNGAGGGVVTVEVLNQLIRENPANMTQAVRSWLGRGAKPNN